MRKDSAEKLTGNNQFEGYAIELIHEISKILGFNYTFRLVPDGRYGSLNKLTGLVKHQFSRWYYLEFHCNLLLYSLVNGMEWFESY